jgi:hypothetical protein
MTAEPEVRNHFYRDVPKLGNVAVSRHAQASMIACAFRWIVNAESGRS